jgi:hypothetical protein
MVVDKKNNDRFINYIIIKNMISNSYLMIKDLYTFHIVLLPGSVN